MKFSVILALFAKNSFQLQYCEELPQDLRDSCKKVDDEDTAVAWFN